MDSVSRQYVDADLFEAKSVTCKKGVKEAGEAVHEAMLKGKPAFEIIKYEWPEKEVFVIDCKQKFLAGYRECLIVGGQTRDDETQILFKILEYETRLNLGGLLSGSGGAQMTAIHPVRIGQMTSLLETRLKEGVAMVTNRIRNAIGSAGGQGQKS